MSPIPAPDADSVDRTGSIGLEAAAGPAHNVTRANDFMDLSPPLRNLFFSQREWPPRAAPFASPNRAFSIGYGAKSAVLSRTARPEGRALLDAPGRTGRRR